MTPTAHCLSVVPKMDRAGRNCRAFHRVLTRRALLLAIGFVGLFFVRSGESQPTG